MQRNMKTIAKYSIKKGTASRLLLSHFKNYQTNRESSFGDYAYIFMILQI